MPCDRLPVPGGVAIVCTRGRRSKPCACGRPSSRMCDWKLRGPKAGKTCSAPMCDGCATSPAPGKDLCQAHARVWDRHPRNPKNAVAG